jgi:hypothetical protein
LHFAGEASARLDESSQQWIQSLAAAASQPQKSLLGRYRLLGLITGRLGEIRAQIEKQLEAASPLSRYPDAEKATQEKWEAELNAAIEAEYRRRRAELILLLQWWMRDIWFASMKMGDAMFALPPLRDATAQLAARIATDDAAENLTHLERLQRQLTTNVQEALAVEIGLLKLRL